MKKVIFILLSTIIFSGSNKLGETKRIEPDFKSYEKISGSYYKDSNYIYYNGDRQYLIDLNSFELLNGSYSKDKNGIYIPQRQIKERKTVIYYLSRLNNIDVQTFITHESNKEINRIIYDAEDKNYYYYCGNIVNKK